MRRLLEPLTARVGERMAPSPSRPIGRRVAGTETGVLLGYLAQRVLGQYDLLVPDDDAAADAVYYVGANVLALEKRFAFRPRDFRLWIAIHEVTHRAQFTGRAVDEALLPLARREHAVVVDPDPRRLVQALARRGRRVPQRPQPARRRRARRAPRQPTSSAARSARCRR